MKGRYHKRGGRVKKRKSGRKQGATKKKDHEKKGGNVLGFSASVAFVLLGTALRFAVMFVIKASGAALYIEHRDGAKKLVPLKGSQQKKKQSP